MTFSNIVDKLVSYNTGLLSRQIAENSRKIDQHILELKELERRLCGNRPVKSIA